jgi:hypothetical protein
VQQQTKEKVMTNVQYLAGTKKIERFLAKSLENLTAAKRIKLRFTLPEIYDEKLYKLHEKLRADPISYTKKLARSPKYSPGAFDLCIEGKVELTHEAFVIANWQQLECGILFGPIIKNKLLRKVAKYEWQNQRCKDEGRPSEFGMKVDAVLRAMDHLWPTPGESLELPEPPPKYANATEEKTARKRFIDNYVAEKA